MPPTAAADSTQASAVPRRRSNQVEMAREYGRAEVPLAATPRMTNTAYRWLKRGVSAEREANAHPESARQGTTIRRTPRRSSRYPRNGAQTAAVAAMTP